LLIPVYYNPTQLDAPENDGNRVILVSFNDTYEGRFGLAPRSTSVAASFFSASGERVAVADVSVNGVLPSNLQQIAGSASLVSSGKVFLEVDAGEGSFFGIFSQSLAQFGAGERIPAVAEAPPPGPTPSPGGPTPTPGGGESCGNGEVDGDEECDGTNLDDYICEDWVGGLECSGSLACSGQCLLDANGCDCTCEGDFDCEIIIDCNAFVADCEVVGACESGRCVTNPVGTSQVCNGSDPEFPEELRCE
jgi:hypothetical protein